MLSMIYHLARFLESVYYFSIVVYTYKNSLTGLTFKVRLAQSNKLHKKKEHILGTIRKFCSHKRTCMNILFPAIIVLSVQS